MRATFLLVAVIGAALVGAASPSGAASCTPGQFTKGASSGVVFCGPAKATVKVGGKTLTFSGGTCTRTSKYFNVNIGVEVLSGPKGKYMYFSVLAGQYPGANAGTPAAPKDGTYAKVLVVAVAASKVWALNGLADPDVKVTLKKNRAAGTFTGSTQFSPRVKVTGSFSC